MKLLLLLLIVPIFAGCASSAESINNELKLSLAVLKSNPNDLAAQTNFLQCLRSNNSFSKMAACRLLPPLGRNAQFALQDVIAIADGTDPIAKRHALTLLPKIDPYSLQSVNVLLGSCQGNDVVAEHAIEALGYMKIEQDNILKILNTLESNDAGIVYRKERAIQRISENRE